MTLPLITLTGTPYEQGTRHGEELRGRIAHNLDIYFERFTREVGLSRGDVLDMARQYGAAIARVSPKYADGLRGIADGSGFDLDELTALNVRYEILYYQFGKNAMALAGNAADRVDGCTAFAVLPEASANSHLLMGQNWDWIPEVQGAVLHTTDPDGFQTLAYTEAGIFGAKIGLNSAGLGLAINGMTTVDDDWSRLAKPYHVRCYEILRSRTLQDAISVVMNETRSCSTNFLIAQAPHHVVDIEAAPDAARLLECDGGCLVHTNNFDDPAGMGVVETPNDRRIFSIHRRARLRELLDAKRPISVNDLEGYLQDHVERPYGICRHRAETEPPEKHYITVTSVVMDLDAKTLRLTEGPPCEGPYQEHSL